MVEKLDKGAEPDWRERVFLVALTYPVLDYFGDMLLKRYVGFFIDLGQKFGAAVLWRSPGDLSSLLELHDRADPGEGGVFLIVCWVVVYRWAPRPRWIRIELIRSWIRQRWRRGVAAFASIAISVYTCLLAFDTLASMSLLLVHPFVASWCLRNAAVEVSGIVAFLGYLDREYVPRHRAEKKRTFLDRMVS